ncbi:WAS/WASL-interacting protein family member 3-like isoform X1 [Tyto alba]|uniref:WAS/WASL-interacting protein family member 3-like isoform X1 n=1 Tax=Tyto alba TaxID=56313 RepID=UPI001C668B17|nr:WAS/WASL-interacting protein family member 3-like isoform X1 [Tyto alba]
MLGFPEEPHNVVWRGATHHPRDEAAGNGYEASHLNVGWESLGHPGEGDAALQLGSGSATAGDGTGTSWLFPPLQSCPLTAQRSAGRAPLQVFPTGGLFQLLGWIRRKSLAGIPGRPTQWLCRSRRFQEEAVAHCPPLPQQGRRCKQRSKSKESVIFPPLLPCMAARGPCSGEESLCPSCSRVPQRPPLSTDMPLHLGDTGWKPAGTPCARSAPPATPASLTAGTNTSSRSPRLKHRHVHPPWPPLPLVPPAQAPSEKAPLTPEPAGPALCQGLEAAPPG